MNEIPQRLATVRERIRAAASACHRSPDEITLLAVSKTKPVEDILAAHAAGQRYFGENYLQDALPKIAALHDTDIEWHFVGRLQSNKTAEVSRHFAWVHGLDRLKHAQRLSQQRPTGLPPLQICLQVNLSGEQSKGGVRATETAGLALAVAGLPNMQLRGLMTMPDPESSREQQRRNERQPAPPGRGGRRGGGGALQRGALWRRRARRRRGRPSRGAHPAGGSRRQTAAAPSRVVRSKEPSRLAGRGYREDSDADRSAPDWRGLYRRQAQKATLRRPLDYGACLTVQRQATVPGASPILHLKSIRRTAGWISAALSIMEPQFDLTGIHGKIVLTICDTLFSLTSQRVRVPS